MTTVFMKIDFERSSAVDRVGFDTEGNVYVRFKKELRWYKGKKNSSLLASAMEYFADPTISFGTWANYQGLFSNLTPVNERNIVG